MTLVLDLDQLDRRQLAEALDLLARRLRTDAMQLTPTIRALRDVLARQQATELAPVGSNVEDDRVTAQLLDFDEVADRLRVSRRTVERAVAAGDLAAVTLGRARRVAPVDLEQFIDRLRAPRIARADIDDLARRKDNIA